MSTADDLLKGSEITGESIPVVLALVGAIAKIVNAKDDSIQQLEALETAAEAVKARLDELKFPNESRD